MTTQILARALWRSCSPLSSSNRNRRAFRSALGATASASSGILAEPHSGSSTPVSPTVSSTRANRLALLTFGALGLGTAWWGLSQSQKSTEDDTDNIVFTNWSGTHEVRPRKLYQPESLIELEYLVSLAQQTGNKMRVVGSALSPNGLAFNEKGMISMALLDKVLEVDKDRRQVRVQCGIRVQELVEELRLHGLTLQNYASIREQQIGGFTQVGAHGTGAKIPPVDEQVVAMKLVTPADGVIELSKEHNPELFHLARVGLGCFGIMAEVTLQCVPMHRLLEKTFVTNSSTVRRMHSKWLKDNKHLRYMWIPHTDSVVVVQCNPLPEGAQPPKHESKSPEFCLQPLRDLCLERRSSLENAGHNAESLKALNFAQLRDVLLAMDPLNLDWIKQVNCAEEGFWKRSEGYRVGWSDEILGFECGGQQWVLEVVFPTGTLTNLSSADLDYMRDLLNIISAEGIPAPAPIEQRWTATSSSDLSPASDSSPKSVHSWVGVIMYLPTDDPIERAKITDRFGQYARVVEQRMMPKYGARWHWAKLEVPNGEDERTVLRNYMSEKYPVEKAIEWRRRLDPKGVLGNQIVDVIFPIQ